MWYRNRSFFKYSKKHKNIGKLQWLSSKCYLSVFRIDWSPHFSAEKLIYVDGVSKGDIFPIEFLSQNVSLKHAITELTKEDYYCRSSKTFRQSCCFSFLMTLITGIIGFNCATPTTTSSAESETDKKMFTWSLEVGSKKYLSIYWELYFYSSVVVRHFWQVISLAPNRLTPEEVKDHSSLLPSSGRGKNSVITQ